MIYRKSAILASTLENRKTTAAFHSPGTHPRVLVLLKKLTGGPTTPGPASRRRRYDTPSTPTDILLGRDCSTLLTSSPVTANVSKVNIEVVVVGPIGKDDWLRDVFLVNENSIEELGFICDLANIVSICLIQQRRDYRCYCLFEATQVPKSPPPSCRRTGRVC